MNQQANQFRAEVVLLEPEIPQNTGSIARTCAVLGCPLHLIEPLGFSLEDRYVRRAGLDYWHMVDVHRYPNLEAFYETHTDGTFYFLSKKASRGYHEMECRGRMYFVFGKETAGLPETLLAQHPDTSFRIPMIPGARSLNLSNTVTLVLYEAYRQNNFQGLV